ncbi:MAG: sigma factor [Kofleriaceae bacterium]
MDDELTALVRAGAFDKAATSLFDAYGAEVYGFLVNYMAGESDAAEVFGQLGEDVWRGLPAFGFKCSLRTWLYVLARNAAARYRRSPWRKKSDGESALDHAVARARTGTSPWQQTDVKDRMRELRESLDPEDRMLLVLRVDRNLEWIDCARVMLDGDDDDAALARESARLRKRFQAVKDELRARAKAAGLVE